MAKITINGKEVEVEDGITVLQACAENEVEIPRFCYHERLRIAGNCRMCLVEIEKAPKPVASCAMPVNEGMVIHTDTPLVQKAREGVMEFMLINHPLDCPICDQGGECDLQDQAFKYGRSKNRFHENKRAVKDKNMGPLVKTQMTRCIHCTRCVRFITDIAGVEELGAIGRGEDMEITTYLEQAISSELSGNVIDLCPVGALTSKPAAFKARSWELKSTESVDVFDAMGCNIRIDTRGLEVIRILPKNNDDINEEWISDKARFACDGLKRQRLDRPYIKVNGKLTASSWAEAKAAVAAKVKEVKANEAGAIAGTMIDAETMFACKILLEKFGCYNYDFNQYSYHFDTTKRGNYLFNTSFAGLEQADLILLIGTNLRHNAPVLNARIGKLTRFNNLKVAHIGQPSDQTYQINELGSDLKIIQQLITGSHPFTEELKSAKNPVIIIGDSIYSRPDAQYLLAQLADFAHKNNIIRSDWNGFNIAHNHASTVAALDLGFTAKDGSLTAKEMVSRAKSGDLKLLFLLGADEIELNADHNSFIVYIGHHGDKGAHLADIILPASAYTEKDGIYVNMEGRVQLARRAVQAPNKAKADYEIIMELAQELSADLGFSNLQELRTALVKSVPSFSQIDNLTTSEIEFSSLQGKALDEELIKVAINFYQTDAISRSSPTMAQCVKTFLEQEQAE